MEALREKMMTENNVVYSSTKPTSVVV